MEAAVVLVLVVGRGIDLAKGITAVRFKLLDILSSANTSSGFL